MSPRVNASAFTIQYIPKINKQLVLKLAAMLQLGYNGFLNPVTRSLQFVRINIQFYETIPTYLSILTLVIFTSISVFSCNAFVPKVFRTIKYLKMYDQSWSLKFVCKLRV